MSQTVTIAGSLAQKPGQGGHTWVFLQYLLGFKRLGWDVLFVDELQPGMCVDEAGAGCAFEQSWNLRYFLDVMEGFGLGDSFALIYNRGERFVGLSRDAVGERVKRSALLLNVMGYLGDEEILAQARRRVFLDIDPGFGQMWKALGLSDVFKGHDAFVTIGENIGRPDCAIPTCGLEWITTPQPVVLAEWGVQEGRGTRGEGRETRETPSPQPLSPEYRGEGRETRETPSPQPLSPEYRGEGLPSCSSPADSEGLPSCSPRPSNRGRGDGGEGADEGRTAGAFTSIGAWRGPYGPVEYEGRSYGLRVHEFRKFVSIPKISGQAFEVALDIHPSETRDLELLRGNGWSLADPRQIAADPWVYQNYVRQSKAEFMVAKNMYVQTNSGWFSDRSICYLASGRPVLAQDTRIKHLYPTGEGLLTFSTLEAAAAGIEAINADYERHCKAAREIAVEHFDSDKVLTRLLAKLGV